MKIVPLPEAVHLPFFAQHINEEGKLTVNEITIKAADNMLKELLRWTKGLKIIRENKN